uniref:ribosomal protein S20 n=1 Tax=Nemalion vermiculare TaxID=935621 RepID=UPI00257E854D|nr:ribosomal protein S20 [Nemalion vermiculare]WGV34453.1 ribosomal protein S20 [Nemalion vermiculare]
MAKNASVVKSIAVANRNNNSNKIYKSTIKTLTKKFLVSSQQSSTEEDIKLLCFKLSVLYSKIDKAVKKGVLHSNNAGRKKAFLAKALTNSQK